MPVFKFPQGAHAQRCLFHLTSVKRPGPIMLYHMRRPNLTPDIRGPEPGRRRAVAH
jgi:hypothetical protein